MITEFKCNETRGHFFSDPGSRMKKDFEIRIDKKGHKKLEEVGEHDIYEQIQSYYEDTKIENIIARAAAGDVNALNQRQGAYLDITDAPKSLMEAQNSILKLSQYFDKLPVEVREKFDNSKERFVSLYGTDEFIEYMGWNTEKEAEKAPEVEFVPENKENSKPLEVEA